MLCSSRFHASRSGRWYQAYVTRCGKSGVLLFFALPCLIAAMLYFVVWDVTQIGRKVEVGDDQITLKNHAIVTDVALMLGDCLLLRHLIGKWAALRTRDVGVSLFLETHVHIGRAHSGGGDGADEHTVLLEEGAGAVQAGDAGHG